MRLRLTLFLAALLAVAVGVQASAAPFNETIDGPRNLGQSFSFTLRNLTGTRAAITYHFNVYDYRILGDTIHYYSPAWGTWRELSADPGRVYIAIWLKAWSEGTSYIKYRQASFPVLYQNHQWIPPDPVLLEDMHSSVSHDHFDPADIRETWWRISKGIGVLPRGRYGYRDGWEAEEQIPGLSNMDNGFIIYQIPATARPEDLQVAGSFPLYTPLWSLAPIQVEQPSLEKLSELIQARARSLTGRIAEITRTRG